ncbi:YbgC/FadM family acyl-CoA thioesterase [Croceibacterium sp. TMG7-5b_MA50]|uniref:YbgC/FadM family acyl-CoA thioesterase n=1 Tax=Croceibacterium sp. TMG7-5b_MA50 TaxID=3121290 RepID=UPI003221A50E
MQRLSPPTGILHGTEHLFALRVYYEDTDLSGIAYHANYLRWFERARSDLLRLLGVDQRAAAEDGTGTYAVSELSIRYLAPARLDDAVLVRTRTLQSGAASVRLIQQAWLQLDAGTGDADDRMLAEAQVRVGFVGPGGRPVRQPAGWRAAFQSFIAPEVSP